MRAGDRTKGTRWSEKRKELHSGASSAGRGQQAASVLEGGNRLDGSGTR